MEARKYGRLYYKADHHWNKLGAYFAYREIAKRIREDFPAVKMIESSDVSFRDTLTRSGNLAIMTDLSDYIKEVDILPTLKHQRARTGRNAGYKPPQNDLGDDYELVRETGDVTLPRAVVIRDSFTNALKPYLDETFQKTVYIFDGWNYYENTEIIDHEKPDLVLLIVYEPHIHNVGYIP
jgi:hypothetical protein